MEDEKEENDEVEDDEYEMPHIIDDYLYELEEEGEIGVEPEILSVGDIGDEKSEDEHIVESVAKLRRVLAGEGEELESAGAQLKHDFEKIQQIPDTFKVDEILSVLFDLLKSQAAIRHYNDRVREIVKGCRLV